LRWLQGDYADAGYVELSHNGQGFRLGNGPEDVLGNTQTLRLFGLGNTRTGSIGLSLYHDISNENPFSGTPAVDDDWRLGKGLDTDFLVAADSSWRLSQTVERKQWQLSTFAGRDNHTNRMESGLFASMEPDKLFSVYSNLTSWNGSQPGYDWTAGGTHRFGSLFVGIDNTLMSENSDFLRETGVGLILPLHNGSLAFRAQHGIIDPTVEFGLGSQKSNIYFGSYSTVVNSLTVLSLTAGSTEQTGSPSEKFVALSASHTLNNQWNLYADVVQRLDKNQRQIQLAVGYRIDQNWQLRFLCGPSALVSTNGQTPEALGIQITRSLNIKHVPSGSVQGEVILEGKPYTQHLAILLDDDRSVKTDSRGRFKLTHIPPGTHAVQIDPASLPADLSPDKFETDIEVKAGKTSDVVFSIRRVSQILGSIKVLPDALGQVDPTANIGVTITAGENYATTTDQDGHFVLGDVPAGTYTVALNKGTIPPDFVVEGPDTFTVTVVPDQPSPVVQFTIRPGRVNVEFAENTPATPPDSAVSHRTAPSQPRTPSVPARPAAKAAANPSVQPALGSKKPAVKSPAIRTTSSVKAMARKIAHPTDTGRAKIRSHVRSIGAGMRRGCVGCSANCHSCRNCRCAHCGCSNGRCTCAMHPSRMRHHRLRRHRLARLSALHPRLSSISHRHHRVGLRRRSRLCRCYCRPASFPRHRNRSYRSAAKRS
jgi:hypothetical protein